MVVPVDDLTEAQIQSLQASGDVSIRFGLDPNWFQELKKTNPEAFTLNGEFRGSESLLEHFRTRTVVHGITNEKIQELDSAFSLGKNQNENLSSILQPSEGLSQSNVPETKLLSSVVDEKKLNVGNTFTMVGVGAGVLALIVAIIILVKRGK